ncbi:MAG: universal stress protein [Deltaproteobacteria bacterium]|nr:MAG: universal stress protein [Deltaproteobacteria bacterium]
MGAEIVLFHAFDRPALLVVPVADRGLREYLDQAAQEAEAELRALAETVRGVRCRALSVEGRPWREILAAAEREHCDLIVMGSHGRGALTDWVVGGVTGKVLQRSKVPVLVVPVTGDLAAAASGEAAGVRAFAERSAVTSKEDERQDPSGDPSEEESP